MELFATRRYLGEEPNESTFFPNKSTVSILACFARKSHPPNSACFALASIAFSLARVNREAVNSLLFRPNKLNRFELKDLEAELLNTVCSDLSQTRPVK